MGKPDAIFKKYPFLKPKLGEGEEIQAKDIPTIVDVSSCVSLQGKFEHESLMPLAKSKVLIGMDLVQKTWGKPYTNKELLVVQRANKDVEVWTLVAFKPQSLYFVPFTTEIKDRYWTMGRSSLADISSLPRGKNLVLDGRPSGD